MSRHFRHPVRRTALNFCKQAALIAGLSILLVALAIMPAKPLEDAADELVNINHIYDFEPENFRDTLSAFGGDAFARLRAIGQMNVKAEDLVITWEQGTTPDLVLAVEEQIACLQELGALPKLVFSKGYGLGQRKFTYLDANDPGISIPIWEILLEYEDVSLCVFMDAETYVLYDIFVWSPDGHLDYDEKAVNGSGFFEYLMMFSESPEADGEFFDILGDYTQENIRLHAVSHDDANIYRSYSFWALEDFDEDGTSVTGGYISVSRSE